MPRLQDKVAFITGAGAGIGRCAAELFAREGAKVVIAELDPASGGTAAASIAAQGGDALFVRTDVTDEASVASAVAQALSRHSRIDVVFNSAGGSSALDGPVSEVDLGVWDHTMNLDLLGTFLVCRHAIPAMVSNRGGAVINVATWGALRGALPKHVYTAAKGAIVALTRALAGEYARHGVRVNAIAPGVVRTARSVARHEDPATRVAIERPSKEIRAAYAEQYPFSIGEPIDIANIALFLACEDSRMVTGATIPADGGRSAY